MTGAPLPLGPAINDGDRVRVWPGERPGRSGVTRTMGGVTSLGDLRGVFVLPGLDDDGQKMPGGFYVITHVQRVGGA